MVAVVAEDVDVVVTDVVVAGAEGIVVVDTGVVSDAPEPDDGGPVVPEPEVPWFEPEVRLESDDAELLGPEPDDETPLLAPEVPEPVPEPGPELGPDDVEPLDPEPDEETPLLTPEVPEPGETGDAALVPEPEPGLEPEPDDAKPGDPGPDDEIPLLSPEVPEPGELEDAESVPELAEPDEPAPLLAPELPLLETEDAVASLEPPLPCAPEPSLNGTELPGVAPPEPLPPPVEDAEPAAPWLLLPPAPLPVAAGQSGFCRARSMPLVECPYS